MFVLLKMYKYKLNVKIMGQIYYQLAPMQTHIWHKKNYLLLKARSGKLVLKRHGLLFLWLTLLSMHL